MYNPVHKKYDIYLMGEYSVVCVRKRDVLWHVFFLCVCYALLVWARPGWYGGQKKKHSEYFVCQCVTEALDRHACDLKPENMQPLFTKVSQKNSNVAFTTSPYHRLSTLPF